MYKFLKKTYTLARFQPGIFCSVDGRDDHCAVPPGDVGQIWKKNFRSLFRNISGHTWADDDTLEARESWKDRLEETGRKSFDSETSELANSCDEPKVSTLTFASKAEWPGPDVIIFKNIFAKKSAKTSFLTKNKAKWCKISDHNIGLHMGKTTIFSPKIVENRWKLW
jgi:hypothetical protein